MTPPGHSLAPLVAVALALTACGQDPVFYVAPDGEAPGRDVGAGAGDATGSDAPARDGEGADVPPPDLGATVGDLRPTEDAGGDAGAADGDAGAPACPTVCFAWVSPEPYEPAEPSPGTVELEFDACNPSGLVPEVCPERLACGAAERAWIGPTTVTTHPWCEGDGGPYVLEFEVGPEPAAGVPVALTFLLNSEGWPRVGPGAAGDLLLRPRDGSPSITLSMPVTTSGRLEASLPIGVYDVLWTRSGSWAWDTFPSGAPAAVLEVAAPGEDLVDVPSATLAWSVTLDGTALPAVPAGTSNVIVSVWGAHTPPIARYFFQGDALSGAWAVWPDTFRADVAATAAEPDSPFPSGGARDVTDPAVADAGRTARLVVPVATARVSGVVTVDGTGTSGSVVFSGAQGAYATLAAPGGRFSGRVSPGTYAVHYQPDYRDDLPNGTAQLARTFTAPGTLDRALTTVDVSGTITLNRAAPQNDYRGTVVFYATDGSTASAPLSSWGPADYATTVFSGTYDVHVRGDGQRLPATSGALATGWRAVSTHQSFDVVAHRVDVTLTLDGHEVAATGAYPGTILFAALDASGAPAPDPNPTYGGRVANTASIGLPSTGALSGHALLPPGRWQASYYGVQGGPVPFGNVAFEVLEVRGPLRRTWNVESIDVTVRLLDRGAPLAPNRGADRGLITLGGAQRRVPGSGASEVSTRLLRGDYDLSYICDDTSWCSGAGLATYLTLAQWLRL